MEARETEAPRGYLREDFRLFHLRDKGLHPVEYHYHDFHKLMLLMAGSAEYVVEGHQSRMQPGDIAVVPSGCFHRPIVPPGGTYDRMILYLSPEFLRRESTPDCNLEACFTSAQIETGAVWRLNGQEINPIRRDLLRAESTLTDPSAFGGGLQAKLLVLEMLLSLTGFRLQSRLLPVQMEAGGGKSIEILRYIEENLTEDLTVESIASHFFVSPYHMMHFFREETGFTIHACILAKRLMLAREMIAAGTGATEACFACGCKDYSSFARAYKKRFGVSPKGFSVRRLESGVTE